MRILRAGKVALIGLTLVAAFSTRPVSAADEKPSITVVLPGTDAVFNRVKFIFEVAGDNKGAGKLQETVELFLVGVDTTTPLGIRIYSTAEGLKSVYSVPAKPADFKKLLSNLWDLDVKTAPPPDVKLIRQVPAAKAALVKSLHLDEKTERLIFGLTEGILRFDGKEVHLSKHLAGVRAAKGGLPPALIKGHDLAILIDGHAQAPEERKKGFEKAKTELVGALTKGEKEDETAFDFRKAYNEHLYGEFERFFVEASRIQMILDLSTEKKDSAFEIEMEGLPGTPFHESIQQLSVTPDEFTGVSKTDTVLALSLNFPLDPMRKAFVGKASQLKRAIWKKAITDNDKLSDEQKQVDGDIIDVIFDVFDGAANLGILNGFARSWLNTNGSFTTVAAGKVPEGSKVKFEALLEKIAARGPANKVEMKVDAEADVEIHKATVADIPIDLPELLSKDEPIYVGLNGTSIWLATGEKSLDRLKKAISDARMCQPKVGPDADLVLNLGPWVGVLDSYRTRHPKVVAKPAEEPKKADDSKKKTAAKAEKKVEGMISGADLRKLALAAFKEGKDTMAVSLHRENEIVKLRVQNDEGSLRFIGRILSKIVKDNLEDE